MSLGIKSSAFLRVEHPFARKSEVQIFLTCLQLVGTLGTTFLQEFGPIFFDMSSASGYMGAKYFQEFGPRFLTCPQLVGTWVQNIFRKLVPDFRCALRWNCLCLNANVHIYLVLNIGTTQTPNVFKFPETNNIFEVENMRPPIFQNSTKNEL